jgi:phage terminase small subunit
MALTDKQELFAKEYIVDLNATQAAIRAGYSPKTAYSIGEENLRKPEIESYIQHLMDDRSKRTEITADMVLKEYAKLGFSDITNYLKVTTRERMVKYDTPDGIVFEKEMMQSVDLYDTEEVDPIKMHAVAEIKQTKDGIALKLHDKKGALDSIARHLGMFNDNLKLTGGLDNSNQNLTNMDTDERRARIDELNRRRGNGASTTA